jgi:electron transport complex protein RnfE
MNDKPSLTHEFGKGIWKENPNLAQLLGMCPMLAITNEVVNAIGMGAAVIFVLVCSAIMISLIRNIIPNQVRIAVFIVIIAGFVTIADRYLAAFHPDLSKALGPFVPLIVVNCIIIGRMEVFSARNNVGRSILDALGMSLGYCLVMLLMGSIREILGAGTWLGFPVLPPQWYDPMMVFILPAGAFFTLGTILAVSKLLQNRFAKG